MCWCHVVGHRNHQPRGPAERTGMRAARRKSGRFRFNVKLRGCSMGRRGPGRGASSRGRPPPRPRARVRCGFCSPFVFRGVTPRRGSSGTRVRRGCRAPRPGPRALGFAPERSPAWGEGTAQGRPPRPPAPAHTGERPPPSWPSPDAFPGHPGEFQAEGDRPGVSSPRESRRAPPRSRPRPGAWSAPRLFPASSHCIACCHL